MSGGEVIKSFLVGLGFGVDDSSLAAFNKAITSASARVLALYASVKVAAAGIFWGVSKISEGFEQMGYEYRIIAPAINKALVLRNELLKAYRTAGINITKTVQESVKFNMSLAKTKFALEAIYKSVGVRFIPLLTKQMDAYRKNLYANLPKIQAALEKFILFIFKAFEATAILGARVWSILQRIYDFFVMLHKASDGWSTVILGLVAAWKYLNLSFLATPLGMLLTFGTALLALYDDFMTFREGGESLLDWGSSTTKMFVGLAAVVAGLGVAWGAWNLALKAYAVIAPLVTAATWLFDAALAANPIGLIVIAVAALIAGLTLLIVKWDVVKKGFMDFFSGIGGKVLDFVAGSPNVMANLQNNPASAGAQQPLGTNISSQQQTNQHVNQQTTINVMGSADANATAKATAGEQTRVNFDMTRNLRPVAK